MFFFSFSFFYSFFLFCFVLFYFNFILIGSKFIELVYGWFYYGLLWNWTSALRAVNARKCGNLIVLAIAGIAGIAGVAVAAVTKLATVAIVIVLMIGVNNPFWCFFGEAGGGVDGLHWF